MNTQNYFKVISEVSSVESVIAKGHTDHAKYERNDRFSAFEMCLVKGRPIAGFVVDRKHEKGLEIHIIYSNGLVSILNKDRLRIVTKFCPSPSRMEKYWTNQGKRVPRDLEYILSVCRYNVSMGYNNLFKK